MATKKKAIGEGKGGQPRKRGPVLPDGGAPWKGRGARRFTDVDELNAAVLGWARETIVAGLGSPPAHPSDPPGLEGLFGPPPGFSIAERLTAFESELAELLETARANPVERELDEEARKVAAQLADAIRVALTWANAPSVAYWRSGARLALAEVLDDDAWAGYLARLSEPLAGVSNWDELAFLVHTLAHPLDGKITRRSFSRRSPMTIHELTAAIILTGRTGTTLIREAIRIQVDQGRPGATVSDGVDATRKRVRTVLQGSMAKRRKRTRTD